MNDSQVFLPTGILLNTNHKWILGLVVFPVMAAAVHIYAPEFLIIVPLLAVITFIFMLTSKQPVSVAISVQAKALQYTYQNCWGNNRTITVDLGTVGGYYE